jgi:hypothetical protein
MGEQEFGDEGHQYGQGGWNEKQQQARPVVGYRACVVSGGISGEKEPGKKGRSQEGANLVHSLVQAKTETASSLL